MLPSIDLVESVNGLGGPDEWLGVVVVLGEVAVDGDIDDGDAHEHAAANALAGDLGDNALDEIWGTAPSARTTRWA